MNIMQLESRGKILDLSRPQVMGILNVTPDSFSDGGHYHQRDAALRHAEHMVEAGAAIIDVGGESTRPGSIQVSLDEELARVIPIVESLTQYFDVWISIDTSKPEVMRAAAMAGAHFINDVRCLQVPGALQAAVELGLPICLMHMQGQPETMQQTPYYENVLATVDSFFALQIQRCVLAGIPRHNLILDPGFGFGKTLQHNYQLLAQLAMLKHFNLPMLVGMSRKSMIGHLLQLGTDRCLAGSLACAVIAAMQGAQIIRAHDVRETVEAMRVVEATLFARRSE